MNSTPISAYETTRGLLYFPRMLDKIRKFARGELRSDFHANLGIGLDGRCCGFLGVSYDQLKARVLSNLSDEAVLDWCVQQGGALNGDRTFVWNEFVRKRGWNDEASGTLAKRKDEGGLGSRSEIQTMVEYFEYDEGRKK